MTDLYESLQQRLAEVERQSAMYAENCTNKIELCLELRHVLRKAAYELNSIRARDGAPQIIYWDRGRPLQTDACDSQYFDSLVDECFAVLQKADDSLEAKP